jgi:transcriptional regulator with XRE-family HTH domain
MTAAKPGVALKALRKRKGWTLADVSQMTKIPASTLSRIETDNVSPTYDLLTRLSSGLQIDLTQLLAGADAAAAPADEHSSRRSVNRLGEGEVVDMGDHILRYLSNDLLKKQFTPIVSEYRARSLQEFGEFMRHSGEEFLYVIEGKLELHTEVYAPVTLSAGESIYFDSRMAHAYVAVAQPCRALCICTAPRMHDAPVAVTADNDAPPTDQRPGHAKPKPRPRKARPAFPA